MQSHPTKLTTGHLDSMAMEQNDINDSAIPGPLESTLQKSIDVTSLEEKENNDFNGSALPGPVESTLQKSIDVTSLEEKESNDLNGSAIPGPVESTLQKSIDVTSLEEKESNDLNSSAIPGPVESTLQKSIHVTSLEEEESNDLEDEGDQLCENAHNQLVVYDPAAIGTGEIEAVPNPIDNESLPFPRYYIPNHGPRILPSVGTFTAQCAGCFKWRLIPTKGKYEEIRSRLTKKPFVCEEVREWRPEVSCADPADIYQDGSRLWAIDKPNIALPPPGWERLLRIRGEGSTKFADVYYVAPSGKRLRSMVEIQKYLQEHPDYIAEGVTMSQFSFQIPRPLQENYVRKRPARTAPSHDASNLGIPGSFEPSEVNPISWAGPVDDASDQLGEPGLSTPYFGAPDFEPVNQAAKKARMTPPK